MSNPDTHRERKSSTAVHAEAAAWIARLHGPERSPQLEAGLRQWLAEDPDNARVFERMTESWEAATSVSANGQFPRVATQYSSHANTWARAAIILVGCGIAGIALYTWLRLPSYSTGVGEQRIVHL